MSDPNASDRVPPIRPNSYTSPKSPPISDPKPSDHVSTIHPSSYAPRKELQMSDPNPLGLSDNAAGGLAYITIIPAIVFLILEPYKRSSFVRFHAWQSIFFVAWAVIDILVAAVQNIVPSTFFQTWTVLQLVGLALFLVWIYIFVNAFGGKRLKLPIIGDIAEKQANRTPVPTSSPL